MVQQRYRLGAQRESETIQELREPRTHEEIQEETENALKRMTGNIEDPERIAIKVARK